MKIRVILQKRTKKLSEIVPENRSKSQCIKFRYRDAPKKNSIGQRRRDVDKYISTNILSTITKYLQFISLGCSKLVITGSIIYNMLVNRVHC